MNGRYVAMIIVVATVASVTMGVLTGSVYDTFDGQLLGDYERGEGSVATALNLLERGTFGTEERPFFGLVPRGPVLPLVLAVAFLIFGPNLAAVWIVNGTFWLLSLVLLYAISRHFLPNLSGQERWAPVPSLLLAVYWGASIYPFIFNAEALTFFLITAFILLVLRYLEEQRLIRIILLGFVVAALVLVKPITLYAYPLIALGFFVSLQRRRILPHLLVFALVVSAIVGSWQWRQWRVLGSAELGAGGHMFLVRALSDEFTGEKLKGFVISAALGDYLTDKIVPGFADEAEPERISRTIGPRWRDYVAAGLPDRHINNMFWDEAFAIVKAHPLQHLLLTPVWMLRLNNPVRYTGVKEIDHLFVGTHENVPDAAKVAIILAIRSLWYAFLAISVVGAVIFRRDRRLWWIFGLILYFNVMHSLFIWTQVRYILPMMPFYILLFTLAVMRVAKRERRV